MVHDSPHRWPKLRAFTLLVGSSLTVMAATAVAPAKPEIAEFFADEPMSELLATLVLTLPALLIVGGAPLAGFVVDRWGRKRLFVASTILYALGGSSGFYCTSLYQILVGRAVLGLAVAGVMTCCTTLIGDYYDGPPRRRFLGWQSAFMALGGVVFLMTGGLLANFGWRMPFLVYLTALLLVPAVLAGIYEPDRPGKTARTASLADARVPRAMVAILYALGFWGMAHFYIVQVYLPEQLKQLYGTTPFEAGIALATVSLSGAVASWQYRWVRRWLSFPFVVAVALPLMGGGYGVLFMADGYPLLFTGLILSGLGFGLLIPNLNLWLLAVSPETVRGRLVGGLTTSIFLGQFFSWIVADPFIATRDIGETFGIMGAATGVLGAGFAVFCVWRGCVLAEEK